MPEGTLLILSGLLGILTVTCLYPLFLLIRAGRARRHAPPNPETWPDVTIISAVHNAGELLPAKIQNFKALDYPADKLSLLMASDASTDLSYQHVIATNDTRIRWIEQPERRGKAAAMNLAAEQAHAQLLLFSDADAILDPQAVRLLARHFTNQRIGAVCGQRVPEGCGTSMREAQATYIHLDSAIKQAESSMGRITSNDGKIHMIRASLYTPIPPDVTDDLFTALSIISKGYEVVFEPAATATVRVPSRNASNEIQRRRRIVTRSLTGIMHKRNLLNPMNFGWFAIGLLINKVGRRLLPFFLLALLAGLYRATASSISPATIAITIVAMSAVAILLHGVAARCNQQALLKAFALLHYVTAGLVGTALGVIDFILGRRVSVWEPNRATCRNTE